MCRLDSPRILMDADEEDGHAQLVDHLLSFFALRASLVVGTLVLPRSMEDRAVLSAPACRSGPQHPSSLQRKNHFEASPSCPFYHFCPRFTWLLVDLVVPQY